MLDIVIVNYTKCRFASIAVIFPLVNKVDMNLD